MPRLVLLVVHEQLGQHGADVGFAERVEHGERRGLELELHADDLLGGRVGVQGVREQAFGGLRHRAREVARGREQVVVHHVEMAGLVVGLAGGGHPGLDGLERVGELRGDLPGGELAPHDAAEDPLRRRAVLGAQLGAAVFVAELFQHCVAVPGEGLTAVVDVLHLGEALGGGGAVRHVEHVVGEDAGHRG
jgi:hypothetical protein